jgi:hypothetical protein
LDRVTAGQDTVTVRDAVTDADGVVPADTDAANPYPLPPVDTPPKYATTADNPATTPHTSNANVNHRRAATPRGTVKITV